MTPHYTHNTNCCKFLGSIRLNQVYDLYHCNHKEPILIARYGNEEQDYALEFYETDYQANKLIGIFKLNQMSTYPRNQALAIAAFLVLNQ